MTEKLVGTVTKVGKVKDYGHTVNWGRSWHSIYKFFMEVETQDEGTVLAMVQCDAEDTRWGFKIPKEAERQKPFVGDKVGFTTHRIRENGAKWASVTFNQKYVILEENKKAREERDAWVAEQKAKRQNGGN
jgi:hypothetical protein